MTDPTPPSEPNAAPASPAKKEPTARQLKAQQDWAEFGRWKAEKAKGTSSSSTPAPATARASPPPQPPGPASTSPASPGAPEVALPKPKEWFDHFPGMGDLVRGLPKIEFPEFGRKKG